MIHHSSTINPAPKQSILCTRKKYATVQLVIKHAARCGVCSFAALWIRRARPCACAWRTESVTLTSYTYLTSVRYPFLIIRILPDNPPEWPLHLRHRAPGATRPIGCDGFWSPKTAPRRPQDGLGGTKIRPRWPKTPARGLKMPPRRPKRPQRRPQGSRVSATVRICWGFAEGKPRILRKSEDPLQDRPNIAP